MGSIEPKQLPRHQKGTGRTTADKVRPLRHGRQVKVTGETAVIDLNVPWLQVGQLLESQGHLPQRARFQARVQADPVEQIINNRQARLWISGARGPMLVGRGFPAEGPPQFLALRQTHQGTIHAQEPVAAPAFAGVLRTINRRQGTAIQLDEGAFLELGPRMGYRPAGHRLKDFALGQLVEKLVQVALDRLHGLLQHKEHEQRKGQLALTGEILGPHAMASQKGFVAQLGAQALDEGGEIIGNFIEESFASPC